MAKQELREPLSIGTTSRIDFLRKENGIDLIESRRTMKSVGTVPFREDDHKVAMEMMAMTIACTLFME